MTKFQDNNKKGKINLDIFLKKKKYMWYNVIWYLKKKKAKKKINIII